MKKGLDLSDVFLIPQNTNMESRDDPATSIRLSSFLQLKIPIIATPMKFISSTLITKLADLGGIGILHRFHKDYKDFDIELKSVSTSKDHNFGVAVGLKTTDDQVKYILDHGPKILCLDVANGYLSCVQERCEYLASLLQKENYKCLLMSGNIVTPQGYLDLSDCGVNLVRSGIANGSQCRTRDVTGVYYPTFSMLKDLVDVQDDTAFIVLDGGIKQSGDAVKAVAAGADLVMMGTLFAQCFESDHDGEIYGMSSKWNEGYNSKSNEGRKSKAEKTMSLEEFITEFMYGFRSGMTYTDAHNLRELYIKAKWVQI